MTIRTGLLLTISILALIIVGFNGADLVSAWKHKKIYTFSQNGSETIELLLDAAGNWAVERGVTNAGLASNGKVADAMLNTISKRRKDGNASYEAALTQLGSYTFLHKDTLLSKVKEAFENVSNLRAQADRDLKLPEDQRSVALKQSWVPAMSKLIVLSQDLRFDLTQKIAANNAELGRQSLLKHFAWIMSEYAGRERAIIGGTLSSNSPISQQKLQTLMVYRGNVEMSWDIVKKLGQNSNQAVQDSIQKAAEVFFGKFEGLRKSIYAAGTDTGPIHYPVTPQGWVRQSTDAINTILGIQKASNEETHVYVKTLIESSHYDLALNIAILFISLAVVGVTFYGIIFRVSGPINTMTAAMMSLADRNLEIEVPYTGRKDEIGTMAAAVQVFKENAIERKRLEEEQQEAEKHAAEEKKKAMHDLAQKFENRVKGIIESVAAAATELYHTSESMTSLMGNTNQKAESVGKNSVAAAQNVQTVAAASEEMSASVKEISTQVSKSTAVVKEAVDKVDNADNTSKSLENAAERIGTVLQLIQDIAEQINLLALNATIEAARAGEAGKGFAVVASEVKTLANQTAKATGEISEQVEGIQGVSHEVVGALSSIKEAINHVNEYAAAISAAVEEQEAVTGDISKNMQTASQGTNAITSDIGEVSSATSEARESANQVLDAAKMLSQESEKLNAEVASFLSEVRNS